jgi:hypothetical protein
MASFVKCYNFVENLGLGGGMNLHTDTLKVFLTASTPNQTTTSVYSDLTDLGTAYGYTAGGADTQNTASESSGTLTVVGTDYEWTASGGSIGAFRYAVLYDDTTSSKWVIGWWDYGSSVTLASGEKFKTDFGASMFTIA